MAARLWRFKSSYPHFSFVCPPSDVGLLWVGFFRLGGPKVGRTSVPAAISPSSLSQLVLGTERRRPLSYFHDSSVEHVNDSIGLFCDVGIVCDNEQRCALGSIQRAEQLHDFGAADAVQSARRFVGQQNGRAIG